MAHSRHASTSASPREPALPSQEPVPRPIAQQAYERPRLRHLTTILVRNLVRVSANTAAATVVGKGAEEEPSTSSLQDLLVRTPNRPGARRRTSTASFSSISTNATLRRTPSASSRRARSVVDRRARASSVASTSKLSLDAEEEEDGGREGDEQRQQVLREGEVDEGEGRVNASEGSHFSLWTATWDAPRLRKLLEQRASQCFVSLSRVDESNDTRPKRIYATPVSTEPGLHHAWGKAPSSSQAPAGIVPALDFYDTQEHEKRGNLPNSPFQDDKVEVALWAKAAEQEPHAHEGNGKAKAREYERRAIIVAEGREDAEGWTKVWQRQVSLASLKCIQTDQMASTALQLPDNVVLLGLESPMAQVLPSDDVSSASTSKILQQTVEVAGGSVGASTAVTKQQQQQQQHSQRRLADRQIQYYIVDAQLPELLSREQTAEGKNDEKLIIQGKEERSEEEVKAARTEVRQKLKGGELVRGYEVEDVLQLLQLQREVSLVLNELNDAKTRSNERLKAKDGPLQTQLTREEDDERVRMLQTDRDQEQEAVKEARRLFKQRREALNRRKARLETARRVQTSQRRLFEQNQAHLSRLTETLDDLHEETHARRVTLLRNLESIYPIDLIDGSLLLFSIVDIPLPNRSTPDEDERKSNKNSAPMLAAVDDDTVSSALGLVGQLVSLLSVYLETPVHYPIATAGSRAVVEDDISVMSGPRAFPLYQRGVEGYRFEYACFLVNKDVEQLMNAHGITVLDIRDTLPNLKNLLVTLTASTSFKKKKEASGHPAHSASEATAGHAIDARHFSPRSSSGLRQQQWPMKSKRQETISLLPSSDASHLGRGPPPSTELATSKPSANGNGPAQLHDGDPDPGVVKKLPNGEKPSTNGSTSLASSSSGWNLGMKLIWGSGATPRQQHQHQATSTSKTSKPAEEEQSTSSATAATSTPSPAVPTIRSLGRS